MLFAKNETAPRVDDIVCAFLFIQVTASILATVKGHLEPAKCSSDTYAI